METGPVKHHALGGYAVDLRDVIAWQQAWPAWQGCSPRGYHGDLVVPDAHEDADAAEYAGGLLPHGLVVFRGMYLVVGILEGFEHALTVPCGEIRLRSFDTDTGL